MTANPLAAVAAMTDQIIKQYPMFADFLKIPEIAKILIEASQPGSQWSPDKVQQAIQSTDWWKTTSQAARQYEVTKLTDPATASNQQASMAQQIYSAAASEGIRMSIADLGSLVDDAINNNWTSGQIQQAVASKAVERALQPGTITATMNNLGSIAGDYGVPVSQRTQFDWAQKIAAGTATQDSFTAYAQQQAKALHPYLADKIDQGFTVRQIADPYMQVAAQQDVLANPAEANLADPKWAAALQGKDAKGTITGPMTLDAWTAKLMSDPQYGWDHTNVARSAASNLVEQLGQAFGVMKQ